MKALIAMSGGVDSSVAAALTLKETPECIGATMKLYDGEDLAPGTKITRGCCSLTDVNDARLVCHKLGIPHYTLNFTELFREEVMRRFVETYERGGTPNPCIDCNRYVKFNRLLFRARELEFDTLVTGHYARIERDGGRWLLKKALDDKKDQSYVLYCLTQDELAHTRLPLGALTKGEVRSLAAEYGFVNSAKPDSQDICFVPDGDYGAFLERFTGTRYPEGDIVDAEGRVLGRHQGAARYTIGQRKGLGVAANDRVYVTAKDMAANTVTLGPEAALYTKTLAACDINLIAAERLDRPVRVTVRTRYQQKEAPATAVQTADDELRVDFDEGQRAVTPGQAVVLYDGDVVIGGGTIQETL
jgi:tRNA-specific 2-thiouridylase